MGMGMGMDAHQHQHRRGSNRATANSIEQEITKMFSRRVAIFGAVSVGDSTEAMLNTIGKASLKAALEAVRTMTLPYSTYVHIQANAMFLKQVGWDTYLLTFPRILCAASVYHINFSMVATPC
jgi:hypothetical protein